VNDLVAHPDRYNDWLVAMHPARACLISALEQLFRDVNLSDSARSSAASVLARFAADDPDILTGLLLDADERQFGVIFDALSGFRATIAPRLTELVKSSPSPAATREERSNFARRQANAAIAGVRLGSIDPLWPLLEASEEPGLRAFLIDRLAPLRCPPAILIDRLTREPKSSVRAALLLSLRQYSREQCSPDERAGLVPHVLGLYRDDSDPAVHSAAGSLLKTWGCREQLRSTDQGLASTRPIGPRRWYIAHDGTTMVLLDGKQNYVIGTAEELPGRKDTDKQRNVDVGPFEIATTEVTVGQYRLFLEHDPSVLSHYPAESLANPDWPQTFVTWYEAAYYCNWRSQQEGIPEEEWCYEPRADNEYLPGMKIKANYQSKIGYRLPTEAEWEYACRAGTVTRFLFGDSHELMGRYACYSSVSAVPVGSFLPNAFGLFDTHGNVFEWCQDAPETAVGASEIVEKKVERCNRGGSFFSRPIRAWSATRYMDVPGIRYDANGFRLVRSRPRAQGS
jgi:eukaryotic-like serine/threonine-protein kinase